LTGCPTRNRTEIDVSSLPRPSSLLLLSLCSSSSFRLRGHLYATTFPMEHVPSVSGSPQPPPVGYFASNSSASPPHEHSPSRGQYSSFAPSQTLGYTMSSSSSSPHNSADLNRRSHVPAPATGPTSSAIASEPPVPPVLAAKPPPQARVGRKQKSSAAEGGAAGAGAAESTANVLPTSRVQKIIKADGDIGTCQKEAVFLISAATVSVRVLVL
jgi:hypothetical protein